jgi:hypothetical protein
MTIPELREVLVEASNTTRKIRVEGYKNSKGEVSDLEVKMLPPDGYRSLVAASIDKMQTEGFSKPEDDSIDAETWGKALMEQEESWRKTMDEEHSQRSMGEKYAHDASGLINKVDDPDYILIQHLEKISRDVTEESEKKTKSRPLTIAKNAIKRQAPIGNYIGSLSFEPGKFESVSIIK